MSDVEKLLFSLIKYGVSGETAPDARHAAPQVLAEVCRLAQSHDMIHLVADALLKLGAAKGQFAQVLERERLKAVYRAERMETELSALVALFESEKIDHLPLKGAVIRRLYPETWMRTSSDIDILVHPEDAERAATLAAERLGYKRDGTTKHDLQLFSPSGLHFELHFVLLEGDKKIDGVLEKVWEHTKGGHSKELDGEMFLFYHVAHMAKHLENGGCGIRPLLDLWIIGQSGNIDGDSARKLLEYGGLGKFFCEAKSLCRSWFGETEPTDVARELGEYILGAGVYGNLENRVAVGQTKRGGKLGYALSRIFLPYSTLKVHYPILKKHKWLFPFCQIRRWFKLLFFGGVSRSLDELKANASTTDEKQKRTYSLFSNLGLRE